MSDTCAMSADFTPGPKRRTVLQALLGVGCSWLWFGPVAAQDSQVAKARPQENDRFVFLFGERQGDLIRPEDVPLGGPPVLAYPMEPHSGTVRNASRLNQLLLLRLEAAALSEATSAHAAAGIVAYSAVCTHTGCPVSEWQEAKQTLQCPCHSSEFDPKNRARVVAGPAPKRLAMLPLKIEAGVLMAAGGFTARVGFKRQ